MFKRKEKLILGLIAAFSIFVTLASIVYLIVNHAALGTSTSIIITTFLLVTATIMTFALKIGFRILGS